MLSKCANPNCRTTFRYLHEGRLYVSGPKKSLAGDKPRCLSRSGQLEYAWLCPTCCLYLTIQIDEELEMKVVRKREAKNSTKLRAPVNDETNMGIA